MRSTAGVSIAVVCLLAVSTPLFAASPPLPDLRVEPASESAPLWSPSAEPAVARVESQDGLDAELGLESIEVPATRDIFADSFEGTFPGAWSVFDDQGVPVTRAANALSRAQAYEGSQSAICGGIEDRPDASSWRVHGPFSLSEASGGAFHYRYRIDSASGTGSIRFLVSIDGIDFHGLRVSGSSDGWKSGSIDFTAVPGLGDVTGLPEVWIAAVLSCGDAAAGETAFVDDVRVRRTTLTAGGDIRITPLSLTFNQTSPRPIFVEIDWMEDGTHSHKPSQAVLDRITQTFAMAGFKITFVVSNAVAHQATLAITTSPTSSSAFTSIMSANFNNSSDSRYYYSLWGHNYSYNGTFTTSSGIADFPPGRAHLISLGSFSGQTGTFSNQVGTFIHEFGHNIGQRHGGADDDNYKPNYLGVMNYHYQLSGVGPTLLALSLANTVSGFDDFSYSHGLMPSLNENSLSEPFGVGLGRAVDWNCSGTFTTGLAKDIQASNYCTAAGGRATISDFDNWTSLASQIRTFNFSETPAAPASAEVAVCATWEENLPIQRKIDRLRDLGLLPPDGPEPGSEVAEAGMNAGFFTIFNDGTDPLNVTSMALNVPTTWVEWEPQAPFTVPAGGSQKVHVYVDFGQAVGGTTTRQIVVQSDDPDESPYPGGVFLSITSTNPIPCFTLTRTHTGSGSDPVATPANSTGCATGQYVAGASISLAATPSAGSQVSGWTGTANDASTATTNTLTMPASNRTVSVAYALSCYTLTLSHTGSGGDPVASPMSSAGCPAGSYNSGASVSLTASPAAGSQVSGWSGTTNNASTSTTNTVSMPTANQSASVTYVLSCYTLTRSHTGSGSDPVASPTNSAGCAVGSYNAGVSIGVTASPSAGSQVASWSGTTNNTSTASTNTVTMPVGNHTVSVAYALSCYTLARSHTGSGGDPVASPANSAGCAAGSYNSGASISMTASPSAGSQVTGWSGTTNNASTSTTNTVTMPVGNHTVSVSYVLSCYTLTLSHTGSGGDPVASPSNSAGCAAGSYNSGASITLTASPSSGSQVSGWSGTINNTSTASTNTVTMPTGNHSASVTYVLSCYTLARSHTGSGSDPVASPTNSAGCATGSYNAGASISMTATPSAGSQVTSWSGTTNNASTSTTNTVTMPVGNHTVSVSYVLSCYTLTLSHTGSGGDPVASPTNSAGCAVGSYNAGASIMLTSSPAAGSQVAGWSGTANDASPLPANTVTMPVGNHAVSVAYVLSCYTLTPSHTGSGSDPGASPPNSAGCPAGQYNEGASIGLMASPAADFAVAGWSGTSNDASLSTINSLIMPFGNHAVAVQYVAVPDVALSNGVAQAGSFTADSAQGTWRYYSVDLDAGDRRLVIDLAGMNQDVNLYVRFGSRPTAVDYDCRPLLGGTADEQCSFPTPAAGRWWIGVNNVATGNLSYQVTARWLIPDMDFYTITPCRAVDTRTGSPLSSGVSATLPITGTCQIPSTARAIAYNVTVLNPTSNGNVVLWPADLIKPLTSSINYGLGDIRANNGMVALALDGSGTLKAESFLAGGGSVHVTIDISGYFE